MIPWPSLNSSSNSSHSYNILLYHALRSHRGLWNETIDAWHAQVSAVLAASLAFDCDRVGRCCELQLLCRLCISEIDGDGEFDDRPASSDWWTGRRRWHGTAAAGGWGGR